MKKIDELKLIHKNNNDLKKIVLKECSQFIGENNKKKDGKYKKCKSEYRAEKERG